MVHGLIFTETVRGPFKSLTSLELTFGVKSQLKFPKTSISLSPVDALDNITDNRFENSTFLLLGL